MKKKVIALLLAAVMVIALAACGAKAGTDTTAANGETAAKANLKLGLITCPENQWGEMLGSGMKAACEDYGVEYLYSNWGQDAAKAAEIFNTYAQMNLDGIIVAPSSELSTDMFRQADEDGIKVGLVNVILDDADYTTAYFGYTHEALGDGLVEPTIRYIKEELGGEAKILNALGFPVTGLAGPRWTNFYEGLQAEFGDKVECVATIDTAQQADGMAQSIGDALTAHPEINLILCGYEASCQGAMSAIENAGLEGKVHVVSVDCSEQMCGWMLEDDPTLIACASQDPYTEAYKATEQVIKTCLGEMNPTKGEITYLEAKSLSIYNKDEVQDYLDYLKGFSGN